ncbi:hypothetical protein PanWU01x14_336620 [Parasponia andersonii]|uniref:Uncharacterized protein n=1 Tax=Parasponia andersonii TaxID=3476 RepID=A0A2P5AFV8_PARAD|nr:hypothetical protein PanWU01x14_336620 [Parasponia andersonii]
MGDKLHRREGNSPDHQLRPLNDRSVIKKCRKLGQQVDLWEEEYGEASPIAKRVHTNIATSDRRNFKPRPSKLVTTANGWVAMEAKTGKVLWSTADPSNSTALGPSPWLMALCLPHQFLQKNPYTQQTPEVDKLCGLMRLGRVYIVAFQ